ncbi:MAG: glycine cleavage T C-terminal barrel domain-containing protein, partial [Xanthobacteraceae bacterium]
LYADRQSSEPIGVITSGGFGPSLNAPIAMGYVAAAVAKGGASVFAELRGERVPLRLAPLPFIAPKYKRQAGDAR